MTVAFPGEEIASRLAQQQPAAKAAVEKGGLVVDKDVLLATATFLKNTPGLDFDYLSSVTAVDYPDYFEVVYHLVSLQHNHRLVLKTRLYDRANPAVSSVTGLWKGADLQEREVYDLMGIRFEGHPNLERIVLWEGFNGHPLRKEFP